MDFFKRLKFRWLLNRGRNLMEAKKYEKAVDVLSKAKEMDSEESVIYYLLGLIEARQEKYTGAIDYLRRSIKLRPESPQYKFDLALCYVEIEKHTEAEQLFKELLETHANEQSLLMYICDLYLKTKQFKKGIELIENIPNGELYEPYLVYQLAQFYNEVGENKNKVLNLLEEAKEKAHLLKDKKVTKEIERYKSEIDKN